MSDVRPYERRDRQRNPWPRRLVLGGVMLLVFALGIAVGLTYDDRPPTPATETVVRTLETLTEGATTTGP